MPSNKEGKASQKIGIETQINAIMSFGDVNNDDNKTKKEKSTILRIFEYAYHESKIDIKFLSTMISLYTQAEFHRAHLKILQTITKPAKGWRRQNTKNPVTEEYKLFLTMTSGKIIEILKKYNSEVINGISNYKKVYNSMKPI